MIADLIQAFSAFNLLMLTVFTFMIYKRLKRTASDFPFKKVTMYKKHPALPYSIVPSRSDVGLKKDLYTAQPFV